jgi:hypothetical protein
MRGLFEPHREKRTNAENLCPRIDTRESYTVIASREFPVEFHV